MDFKDLTITINKEQITKPDIALSYFALMRYGNIHHLPYNTEFQIIKSERDLIMGLADGLIDKFLTIASRELPVIDWEDANNVEKLLHCFAYIPLPHPRLEEMCKSLLFIRKHRDTLKLQGAMNGKAKHEVKKGDLFAIEKGLQSSILDYLYDSYLMDSYQSMFSWPVAHEPNSIHQVEYTDNDGHTHVFVLDRPTEIPDKTLEHFIKKQRVPAEELALVAYNRLISVGFISEFSSKGSVNTNISCLIIDILECLDFKIGIIHNKNTRQAKRDKIKDLIF